MVVVEVEYAEYPITYSANERIGGISLSRVCTIGIECSMEVLRGKKCGDFCFRMN